jgi:hypothetical protein
VLEQLDRLNGGLDHSVAFESFRALDGFRRQAIDLLSGGG